MSTNNPEIPESIQEFFTEISEKMAKQSRRISDIIDQHLAILEKTPEGEHGYSSTASNLHNLAWAQCQIFESMNEAMGRVGRYGKVS
jgi:hypothetical protein